MPSRARARPACPSSPSSAARTSASPRSSTGSSASGRRSSRTGRGRPATGCTATRSGTAAGSSSSTRAASRSTPDDPIELKVQEQARLAIGEADVIVFVVDAVTGLTPADQEAAELLRTRQAPVLVAANKVDNTAARGSTPPSSGRSAGRRPTRSPRRTAAGRGDLLDAIVWALPPEIGRRDRPEDARGRGRDVGREVAAGRLEPFVVGEAGGGRGRRDGSGGRDDDEVAARWDAAIAAEAEDDEPAAIAFVGRPNVGKSSLLNALLGEDRAIVSDVPGHDPRRDRHDARVGPQRGRPDRHGRHQAARQGRLRAGRRALLDPPRAEGDRRAPMSRCS